jgi:peroxiredoxin
MNKVSMLGVLALAAVGLACASTEATSNPGPEPAAAAAVGAPAPAFALEDQTGKRVSLADYSGKIVVLEWINPECPFVVRHADAKTMATLASKYAGKNVVWVGVNSTHFMGNDANAKWIAKHSLPYPILNDASGAIGRAYGARTTPHMYIIDPTGKLVYAGGIDDDPGGSKGASAVNSVDKALDELTSGKAVSVAESKPYGCSVKYK